MARCFPAKHYLEYFSFQDKTIVTHMNFEKPAFNLHDVCDLLNIKDYSQVYTILEERDINATLEYTDWDAYYPAVVVTKEGFSKLIGISSLPEVKKNAIQQWLNHEVMPAVKKNWQENLKPLWKETMSWTGAREWEHADDDDQTEENSDDTAQEEKSLEPVTQ